MWGDWQVKAVFLEKALRAGAVSVGTRTVNINWVLKTIVLTTVLRGLSNKNKRQQQRQGLRVRIVTPKVLKVLQKHLCYQIHFRYMQVTENI